MIRKAIIGASFALGNLNSSSQRLTTINISRLVSNLTSSEKDDYPTPTIAAEITHRRILMDVENIAKAPVIDLRLYIHLLKVSRNFYKPPNSNLLNDLYYKSNFKLLCDNLCDKIVRISVHEAAFILVSLCKLKIDSINPLIVMRFWHRHIDPNIKFLTFVEIEMLLVHVLEHLSNTPWTESKKFTLVQRLKSKMLTEQLERLSITNIISSLNLMHAFRIVDKKALKIFLNSLANQPSPDWLLIFKVIGTLDFLPEYGPLLKEVQKNIFQNIMDLPLHNLIGTLLDMRRKMYQGHLEFYDAKLVNAIIDRAMWDNCHFDAGFTILRTLSSMNHRHLPMLNYLITKIEDMEDPKYVYRLISLFCYAVNLNCDRTPHILLEKLMHQEKTIKSSKEMLKIVTYYMAVLGHYDLNFLEPLFSSIDYAYLNRSYKLKRLISMVKIFFPSYSIPWYRNFEEDVESSDSKNVESSDSKNVESSDSKNVESSDLTNVESSDSTNVESSDLTNVESSDLTNVESSDSKNIDSGYKINVEKDSEKQETEEEKVKIFPLKSKLELLFGGPMYVLTNVKVECRLPVDHTVIFRKGGYPVAVNWSIKSSDNEDVILNKIPIPENSHTVLITSVPWHGYISNTSEMTRNFRSFVKCLKALNYDTIFVSQVEWNKIPEPEKIPWLMQKIKERCQHIYEDVH